MIEVSSELIDYFGKSNAPIFWLAPQVMERKDHLGHLLRDLFHRLETMPLSYDGDTPTWVNQLSGLPQEERNLDILIHVIGDAVAAERLHLVSENRSIQAKPYDHPDLEGISIDSEGLVSLNDFYYDVCYFPGMNRKQTVFEVLLSLPKAVNSMYWTMSELV